MLCYLRPISPSLSPSDSIRLSDRFFPRFLKLQRIGARSEGESFSNTVADRPPWEAVSDYLGIWVLDTQKKVLEGVPRLWLGPNPVLAVVSTGSEPDDGQSWSLPFK